MSTNVQQQRYTNVLSSFKTMVRIISYYCRVEMLVTFNFFRHAFLLNCDFRSFCWRSFWSPNVPNVSIR